MVGMGVVGFLDDYLKIRHRRSLGLNKTAKLVGQLVIGVAFASWRSIPERRAVTPASTTVSYVREIAPFDARRRRLFVLLAYLFIAGFSNAVNLTDGLDGLAAGSSAMVFAAYVFISFWQFPTTAPTSSIEGCYTVRDPLDVTLVAAAAWAPAWASCGGTPARPGSSWATPVRWRWAGCSPAWRSCTRTELLLVVLGGLFVAVTLSVVIQVAFFKATRRRVFRMAPLHHHFELAGWTENTVDRPVLARHRHGRGLRAGAVLRRLAVLRRACDWPD